MKFKIAILGLALFCSSFSYADGNDDKCKDLAKTINESSRAVINKIQDEPKEASKMASVALDNCKKYLQLDCQPWAWIVPNLTVKNVCLQRVNKDDPKYLERTAKELAALAAKSKKPETGADNPGSAAIK